MRLLCAALGIISFLFVPAASADYSFAFSTLSHLDHAGASGAGAGGSPGGETGAGSFGVGGGSGLASAASLNAASPYRGARNSDAFGDGEFDCFDSTSLVADAPRPTASCWLVALTASENSTPLTEKATDVYPMAGGQDWTSAYPPNGFGGSPQPAQNGSDSRSSVSGGGGSAGTAATSTSGESSGGTTGPFHFHSGSDGRGDDILALGQAASSDGSDSNSHHHFHTGDTSTSPSDESTPLVTASSVAPTHHHARDPIAVTFDDVAPTHHHVRDPVVTTTADIVGATVGLNVVVPDTPLTGPSVNFVSIAPQPVPEPGTLVLVGLALVAIAFVSKRNSR